MLGKERKKIREAKGEIKRKRWKGLFKEAPGWERSAGNAAETILPAFLAKGGQRPFAEQTFYYSHISDYPN